MSVEEILKEIDDLLAWDKEKIREALFDRDEFRRQVFALDVDDLNDMTPWYCYEDERKELDEYSLDDVAREFCKSDMVQWLIDHNASILMLSMLNESGPLKGKWIHPEIELPPVGQTILFVPGKPMKPRVYEGYWNGTQWRCTTSDDCYMGEGAVRYWTLRPRLPEELNNTDKQCF